MKERDKEVLKQLSEQWSEEPGKDFELFKNVDQNHREHNKKPHYINVPDYKYRRKSK